MDDRLKDRHLVNELPATFLAVEEQLKEYDKRWGKVWFIIINHKKQDGFTKCRIIMKNI